MAGFIGGPEMTITLQTLTFGLGCVLLVLAIVGGGLEVKEVKIPVLPVLPRALSGMFGALLIALVLLRDSQLLLDHSMADGLARARDGRSAVPWRKVSSTATSMHASVGLEARFKI
jgi:hypothetical protein